ncbi:MAG TPA: serine hydrolase, partial [Candidatus Acidoferrum sp.]|nr:serine hydrolase [Candidatus Acidoferrum sp.]
DLLTYASALLGSEDDALATDLRAATTPRADTGTGRIGLGWQIDERTGIVWHDGGTGGYRSFVGVRTATGSAVVVLSNVSLDPSAADIALHLLEPTFPIVGVSRPAAIELADAVLERYVGKYRLGPEAILDVARDGRGLTAQLTGQARYRIFPTSPTTFIWHVVDAKLAFTVAADGSVPSATLHQHGIDVPAPRIVP